MRNALLILLSLALLAVAAPAASAQDPSTRGYDADSQILGEVGEVEESAPAPEQPVGQPTPQKQPTQAAKPAATPAAASAPDESGSLPFTGLEVGIVALMGALLLGTGVAVRRVSRRGEIS